MNKFEDIFRSHSELEKRVRTLANGQTLFRADEAATTAFLVREGVLIVTCASGDGREVITSIYFPGEICAGLSVLTQSEYMGTGRAPKMSETVVTPISRTELTHLATEEPTLYRNLILTQREKQRFKDRLLLGRVGESCRQRTAGVLLWLHQRGVTQETRAVKTYLCREELADLIGSTTETVIRVLSKFKKEGLIEENSGLLKVDVPALKELAFVS